MDAGSVDASGEVAADGGGEPVGGSVADEWAGSGGTAGGAGMGGAGGRAGSAGQPAACTLTAGVDCCPTDPDKQAPLSCGCGVPETDSDGDGVADCVDPAPRGWLRRLTVDRTQVAGALTDFPLLVRISDSHLSAFAADGGKDICFVAADRTSALDHEIESFDQATGSLVAWVRLPSLDPGADLQLYLSYGDGQSDRSKPSGVWSDHHFVWHLAQDPSAGAGAIKDAAGRADGTGQGGLASANSVSAVAGRGVRFDGMDDQITFSNDVTGNTPSTFQAWVNQSPQTTGLGSAVLSLGNQADDRARFLFSHDIAAGATKVGFYGNDVVGTALAKDTWSHLVWVGDRQNSRQYINGMLAAGPSAHTSANTAGTPGSIGNSTFNSPAYHFFMLGMLDEVRVSLSARSDAWIATEYISQKPDSTFVKELAAPEAAP